MHLIDLTRADTQPLEFSERVRPVSETCGDADDRVGELLVDGVVERTSRGYQLSGRLEGEVVLTCVRCLGEFSVRLAEPLAIELWPLSAAPRDDETRLGREELEVVFFESPALDLAAIAGEQVQLAVPMKPLCGDGCKGICSRCGKSLNEGACGCPPQTDERWAPLSQWRGEQ